MILMLPQKGNNHQATASTHVCKVGLALVVEWSEPFILQQVNSIYALASVNTKRCRNAPTAEDWANYYAS